MDKKHNKIREDLIPTNHMVQYKIFQHNKTQTNLITG